MNGPNLNRCFACLSLNRALKPLKDHMKLMSLFIPEIHWNSSVALRYKICWECEANIRKIQKFKTKVLMAKTTIQCLTRTRESFGCKSLSGLKTTGIEVVSTIDPNIITIDGPLIINIAQEMLPPLAETSPIRETSPVTNIEEEEEVRTANLPTDFEELIKPVTIRPPLELSNNSNGSRSRTSKRKMDLSINDATISKEKEPETPSVIILSETIIINDDDSNQPLDVNMDITNLVKDIDADNNEQTVPEALNLIPIYNSTIVDSNVVAEKPKVTDFTAYIESNSNSAKTKKVRKRRKKKRLTRIKMGRKKPILTPEMVASIMKNNKVPRGLKNVKKPAVQCNEKVSGKKDSAKKDSSKKDSAKTDSAKKDSAKKGSAKKDSAKKESGKKESGKKVSGRNDSGKKVSGKKDSGRKDSGRKDSGKKESGKKESGKKVSGRNDSGKKVSGKKDSGRKDSGRKDSGLKVSGRIDSAKKDSGKEKSDQSEKEIVETYVVVNEKLDPNLITDVRIAEQLVNGEAVTQSGLCHIGDDRIQVKYKMMNAYEVAMYRSDRRKIYSFVKTFHKCIKCIETFYNMKQLNIHNEKHDPSRGEFVCDMCEQRFPDKSTRDIHFVVHFMVYQCLHCRFSTQNSKTMTKHVRLRHKTLTNTENTKTPAAEE